MKQNIFAHSLPSTIELAFGTINFMPEPVASDVRSMDDIPDVVLPFVNAKTSIVHHFYLKIQRKVLEGAEINQEHAANLVQESVYEAVQRLGDASSFACNFFPAYPERCYLMDREKGKMLSPDANTAFYASVCAAFFKSRSNPFIDSSFGEQLISIDTYEGGAKMQLDLGKGFTLLVTSQNNVMVNNENKFAITGTARLFGRPAQVEVRPMNYFAIQNPTPIANWFTRDALHDIVINKMRAALDKVFPSVADRMFTEMITDIEFNLPK